jgi:hypothetical protein
MSVYHNLLIAVDDSAATARAVTYVASIVGRHRDFRLHLPNLVTISWVFVTFGDSGSRTQNCHERGEGGGLEDPC